MEVFLKKVQEDVKLLLVAQLQERPSSLVALYDPHSELDGDRRLEGKIEMLEEVLEMLGE